MTSYSLRNLATTRYSLPLEASWAPDSRYVDPMVDAVGLGSTAVTVFDIAKWPIMLLFVALILSVLYYAGPNVRHASFRWVTPGSALAVILWLIVSGAFALYVASFSSYNKTYGTLGGVIAFLVWLWLTNVVILFGAELNAELERQRHIEAGHPVDDEPYLPPRDDPADH